MVTVGSMTFGIALPNKGFGAGPESLDAAATSAVAAGWRSAWVTDHLIVAGGDEIDEYGCMLEALTALTYVGARHPDLIMGTSVIAPGMRDAPMLAKELATIDVLLDGRLIVGVGASDVHDDGEYHNMGKLDRFKVRGAYLDETIALWRHLWSGIDEPFEGKFHQLTDYSFAPLPRRREATPIWCGGRSARAIRRAAELCDGYHAAQTGPEDLRQRLPKLEEAYRLTGRPWPFVSTRARVKFGAAPGPVYALVGDSESMITDVVAFAEAGNDELVVVFESSEPDVLQQQIQRFQDDVILPAAAKFAERA